MQRPTSDAMVEHAGFSARSHLTAELTFPSHVKAATTYFHSHVMVKADSTYIEDLLCADRRYLP
ncbi:hypothetical protein OH492_05095 [Vibrio chagasii]|nr:hypothetical protein [Vibrio chagasii]